MKGGVCDRGKKGILQQKEKEEKQLTTHTAFGARKAQLSELISESNENDVDSLLNNHNCYNFNYEHSLEVFFAVFIIMTVYSLTVFNFE